MFAPGATLLTRTELPERYRAAQPRVKRANLAALVGLRND